MEKQDGNVIKLHQRTTKAIAYEFDSVGNLLDRRVFSKFDIGKRIKENKQVIIKAIAVPTAALSLVPLLIWGVPQFEPALNSIRAIHSSIDRMIPSPACFVRFAKGYFPAQC